jgi:uncharacterized repeat protein (TIGR03803 family)
MMSYGRTFTIAASATAGLLGGLGANAQTTRHLFTGIPDGKFPEARVLFVPGSPDNFIYGTTDSGGTHGLGVVWKYDLTTSTETVVHSFRPFPLDGGQPLAGLIQHGNFLYGTTSVGGTSGLGTVYRVNISTGHEHVLYSFSGSPDGQAPMAGLLFEGGFLYGTTAAGGSSNQGTVFQCTLSGACSVICNFTGAPDGSTPYGGLIFAKIPGATPPQALLGTTQRGGSVGFGTVFALPLPPPPADIVLHSFAGGADGAYPEAELVADGPFVYSTTFQGGGTGCAGSGCGTVFRIMPSGAAYAKIYSFGGYAGPPAFDAANPEAGLTVDGGLLYGTSFQGGSASTCSSGPNVVGCGTVFRMTTTGSPESVIVDFKDITNGLWPVAGLMLNGGVLYGTTDAGEATPNNNQGTFFSIP